MTGHSEQDHDLRSIQQARHLARRAALAATQLAALPQETLDAILDAMQRAALPRAEAWARLAVEETGFGNVADKIKKNLFSTVDLYHHIRPMKTVGVLHEYPERRLLEIASPVGVVAAIIPSTNPTSTAIYKIFIALKSGNAVVVSPHPYAGRCVAEVAGVLAQAAAAAGAPADAITCMTDPVLAGTTELMRHEAVSVILATGGTGLVRAAYSSGKPAYGVGPGNVPVFVERTADVPKAAADIIAGKSFDNGVLCSSENAVVADAPIAAALRSDMEAGGAFFLGDDEIGLLSRFAVRQDGSLNTRIVGKTALEIAAMAGIAAPAGTRVLVAGLSGVGREHPLSREKLSPILAFYTEDGWEACCRRVLELLRHGGMGHTMAIHSRDDAIIMKFALTKPVFRICVNTPASVGAVGLTTGLEPSMTLGCGALGGNITSDNIMPRHLINLKRLAYETRPFHGEAPQEAGVRSVPVAPPAGSGQPGAASPPAAAPPHAPMPAAPVPEPPAVPVTPAIAGSTRQDRLRELVTAALARRGPAAPRPVSGASRPGSSSVQDRPQGNGAAVAFVSEADVRQALAENRRILVGPRTIITPSARDLGRQHRIFREA